MLVVTSRDVPETQQITRVNELFAEMTTLYPEAKAGQSAAWAKRWQLADVVIEGDDEAQQGIRFNLFQLFSTYYGEDDRLNIGPKGFTGEKYGGATYWDTEAYAVPLYLALAKPEVTKNLLKYRHNQLPQAIHNAQQQGLKGALYPMVTLLVWNVITNGKSLLKRFTEMVRLLMRFIIMSTIQETKII